jgi:hypothetical protein
MTEYPPHVSNGQAFVYKSEQSESNQAQPRSNLDPAGEQILEKALAALESGNVPNGQPGLTIANICDLTGFKDGFTRERLDEIVKSGRLYCLAGAGRRPSYYLLPKETSFSSLWIKDDSVETFHEDILTPNETCSQDKNAYTVVLHDIEEKKNNILNELEKLKLEFEKCQQTEDYLLSLLQESSQNKGDK